MSNEAQYIYRNSSIICIGNTHTYTHKRIIRHRVKGAVLLKKPSKYVHGRVVEVEGVRGIFL